MTTKQKQKKPKPLSWKPRRRGDTYCAPACGHGCTWEERQQAKRNAKALARHMGRGWTTRVHENMGWHYTVISPCGRIKLHEYWRHVEPEAGVVDRLAVLVPDHYAAFLGEPDSPGGKWAESGDTPEEALRSVVAGAKAKLAKIQASIAGLEEWAA